MKTYIKKSLLVVLSLTVLYSCDAVNNANNTQKGAVIGPTVKGPAMIPTVVSSMNEFTQIFGETFLSGGNDQYTYLTSETARQYLKHGNKLTVVRIMDGSYQTKASATIPTGSFDGVTFTGSAAPASSSTTFAELHKLSFK